jgi:lipid II:glycine glycyltransferase (peptidoglycan interpeptide bridge formation enzyme)
MQIVKLTEVEYTHFLATQSDYSFLQTPAWGKIKTGWSYELLGFKTTELIGVGLVLYKSAPIISKYKLAYIPEGPILNWQQLDETALTELAKYLKAKNCFLLKIGPKVIVNRFINADLKAGLADESINHIAELKGELANNTELKTKLLALGFKQETSGGFGDVQPRYTFELDLTRSEKDILDDFNQQWRRNIKKAAAAEVTTRIGNIKDLPKFHELYLETAKRDGFAPRSINYFEKYLTEFGKSARLYLAEHNGKVEAATIWIAVGNRAWYSYGASSTSGRELRPSNALQWRMIQDSKAAGFKVYDLRGISATLNQTDPLVGLLNFKLGLGGSAVEWLGEFDLVLNKPIATAYALARRIK